MGSIRDNPKLLKIRQRFENACQDTSQSKGTKFPFSDSAPSSITFPRGAGSGVLEELLKNNSTFSDKTDIFLKSQLGARRHSEGEADSRSSLSVFVSKQEQPKQWNFSSLLHLENDKKLGEKSSSRISLSKAETDSSNSTKKSEEKNRVVESNESTLKMRDCTVNQIFNDVPVCTVLKSSHKIENKVQIFENVDVSAPPIPKRGISPAVKKNMVSALSLNPSQNVHPLTEHYSSSRMKSSPVKKTIQMYEGMCSGDMKKVRSSKSVSSSQKLSKKDHTNSSKTVGLSRRSSRRNSLRKSKCFSDTKVERSEKISIAEKRNIEESSSKEDSGLGSSDAEDKIQAVYQTLSTVVRDNDDPYDRLNRVHDFVARVHKGQISSCAACRTLPPSISVWPAEEGNSILRIKCHEVSPHHHPPCICFSCSHSVFSCSMDDVEVISQEDDSLYSNVCCLNLPDREGWRQSRRRPVCERNGRLCVVNCDIEQRQVDTCYDKLCEWNSPLDVSQRQKDHSNKPVSGKPWYFVSLLF